MKRKTTDIPETRANADAGNEKRNILARISPATRLALIVCLVMALAVGITQLIIDFRAYGVPATIIAAAAFFIAALILSGLLTLILAALKRLHWTTSLVILLSVILCATSLFLCLYIIPLLIFTLAAVYLTAMIVTGKYTGLSRIKKILRYGLAGLFGVLAIATAALTFWPGYRLSESERPDKAVLALPYADRIQNAGTPMADPSLPGSYSYTVSYYATPGQKIDPYPGLNAIPARSADASAMLNGWNFLRQSRFGFDTGHLPLNAQVWMPDGDGPFPLVLIVHGNHEAGDRSDGGYAYLGELLASRGFIAASADENFLNGSTLDDFLGFAGLKEENDARAYILLEHLRQWYDWNRDPAHPYFGKVDFDALALIGHSRGGEAAAIAAEFAGLGYYPDNGTLRFDYPFRIRTVAAISPVHRQYDPAELELKLEKINYLVMHGEHDMDVFSYMGANMFRRTDVSESGIKAQVWIQYANHGQFNSSWGAHDLTGLMNLVFNTRMLMPMEEQQQAARVFISAFMEATLHGREEYAAVFRDFENGDLWLPAALYITDYADSRTILLDSFDSGYDLGASASGSVSYAARGFDIWTQCHLPGKWINSNRVLLLSWGGGAYDNNAAGDPPVYETMFLPGTVSVGNDILVSLCSGNTGKNEPDVTFQIRLTDSAGNSATMSVDDFGGVVNPVRAPIAKPPLTLFISESEPVLQMVRICTERFEGLQGNIISMEWIFEGAPTGAGGGTLYADDLRVER